jgi:hypothetical protein
MARPVAHLTAPRPSLEEMVSELGIPERRQRELGALVNEARKKWRIRKRTTRSYGIKREEKIKNATAAD